MQHSPVRRDTYRQITDALVSAMETGPGQFVLPWRQGTGAAQLPSNALSKRSYSGINVLSLWVAALENGFTQPIWATYKQWATLGAQVQRGAKATLVVFYKSYAVEPEPGAPDDTGQRRVARASFVFNAEQVTGYRLPLRPPPLGPIERIDQAEHFVQATGASIRRGGDRAFYIPSRDHIQIPDEQHFVGSPTMDRQEAYYATLVHELVHWSGAKHRLARDLSSRFGTEAYAAEELIAEIGSAFLCAELGITAELRPDHAQYLAQWVKLLKQDSRAIFTAAARAAEAANFLRDFSSSSVTADTPPLSESADA